MWGFKGFIGFYNFSGLVHDSEFSGVFLALGWGANAQAFVTSALQNATSESYKVLHPGFTDKEHREHCSRPTHSLWFLPQLMGGEVPWSSS